MEARCCHNKEAKEQAQDGGQRGRRCAPRGVNGGGLDLRGKKGREGDVGDQSGAGIIDEGINLLSLLTAGFNLQRCWLLVHWGDEDHQLMVDAQVAKDVALWY